MPRLAQLQGLKGRPATSAEATVARDGRPLRADRMLEIVKAIPEDSIGRRLLPPATREAGEQLDAMLADVESSPFSADVKTYMKLSLQCGRLTTDSPPA